MSSRNWNLRTLLRFPTLYIKNAQDSSKSQANFGERGKSAEARARKQLCRNREIKFAFGMYTPKVQINVRPSVAGFNETSARSNYSAASQLCGKIFKFINQTRGTDSVYKQMREKNFNKAFNEHVILWRDRYNNKDGNVLGVTEV